MFKSIKSKLIGITLLIFGIFSGIILYIETSEYEQQVKNYQATLEKSSQMLDSTIEQLENNVRSLALSAAAFYYFDKHNQDFINFITQDNFKNATLRAVGGGIWFEPYTINNKAKRFCSYASRHGEEVLLDNNCSSDEYNYLEKPWYTLLKDNYTLEKRNDVLWAKPYYDEIGTKQLMVTVGAPIYNKNYKFIGMVGEDWLVDSIRDVLVNLKPTENSKVILANKSQNYIIAVAEEDDDYLGYFVGKPLDTIPWFEQIKDSVQYIKYNSQKSIVYARELSNGMQLILKIPYHEIYSAQKDNIYKELYLPFLFALVLAFLIYKLLVKNINKPIDKLVAAAKELGHGNFDVRIELNKPREFAQLADTFNKMTTDIQEYLNNIKNLQDERMKMLSDLNIAKEIQSASLPNVFPPFPDRPEIDLFATMNTAKEVGGDFYDFFFIDIEHVVFTVADVSGKGVPAALFMMRAKSLLKSTSLSNPDVEIVMQKINDTIYSNNDLNYFVTIGLGVININTGEVVYVNAGHNPPIIKRANGDTQYLEVPTNIVVGIVGDMKFEAVKFNLEKGDTLFLYTDGVTEATNIKNELYGEERLLSTVNSASAIPKIMINTVQASIYDFVQDYEQADDITMLAITYQGPENN